MVRDRAEGGGAPWVRHWKLVVLAIWLVTAAVLLWSRWSAIHWFALSDTDDNMRISQVRALIGGQGWFDLRQYRLDPPGGANIHWSRIVDLPIAGLILALRPLFGGAIAEKAAVAIAPMIPLAIALFASALAARRLIDPRAFLVAALVALCGRNALAMWSPLRIDHHGWQLAMLAIAVAGLADPAKRRGGVTVALATAASLSIGLEMLPLLALAGGFIALRWIADPGEAARMRGYGMALAGGSTVGYLLFASDANRAPVCDALSPVWLGVTLGGGGLLALLSMLRTERAVVRFGAAALVALIVGGAFALAFPHCLSRPEGVSPELQRLWLDKVREAKPIYAHSSRIMLTAIMLPVVGLIGGALALWRARGTPMFMPWASVAGLALFSSTLLLWQTRAGPSAQLLAVPGATALVWIAVAWAWRSPRLTVRIAVPAAAFVALSGVAVPYILSAFPAPPEVAGRKAIALANRRCPTLPSLRPIAALPPATILTFVDFGPRLITVTHHRAIAGPYHRNQAAILDIHHAFRGAPGTAHDVMVRHGATLLLLCPGMSESTIYMAEAPRGFYARLMKGAVPAWLTPVPLPKGSPFRLFRRVG